MTIWTIFESYGCPYWTQVLLNYTINSVKETSYSEIMCIAGAMSNRRRNRQRFTSVVTRTFCNGQSVRLQRKSHKLFRSRLQTGFTFYRFAVAKFPMPRQIEDGRHAAVVRLSVPLSLALLQCCTVVTAVRPNIFFFFFFLLSSAGSPCSLSQVVKDPICRDLPLLVSSEILLSLQTPIRLIFCIIISGGGVQDAYVTPLVCVAWKVISRLASDWRSYVKLCSLLTLRFSRRRFVSPSKTARSKFVCRLEVWRHCRRLLIQSWIICPGAPRFVNNAFLLLASSTYGGYRALLSKWLTHSISVMSQLFLTE